MWKKSQIIRSLADWCALAPPKGKARHTAAGRSYLELAKAWCPNGGPPRPPKPLCDLLDCHHAFRGTSLTVGCPEHRVRFDAYKGEPRNADLSLLGEIPDGLVTISVEAKADESFGSSAQGTLAAAMRRIEAGKQSQAAERVRDLLEALAGKGASGRTELLRLSYQLFTGVAGALALTLDPRIVHQGRPVRAALLVIHELVGGRRDDGSVATSPRRIERNAKALETFIKTLFGHGAKPDRCGMYGPFKVPGNEFIPADVPLYIGKITQQVEADAWFQGS